MMSGLPPEKRDVEKQTSDKSPSCLRCVHFWNVNKPFCSEVLSEIPFDYKREACPLFEEA